MPDLLAGPGPDAFRGASRLERALLPYLREMMLWPVFLAVLGHVIAIVAPLLVLSVRDGHGWAITGLTVFAGATGALLWLEVRDRGRPGKISLLVGMIWSLCGVGALAVLHFEIL